MSCQIRSRAGRKCRHEAALTYLEKGVCEEHWAKLGGSITALREALGLPRLCANQCGLTAARGSRYCRDCCIALEGECYPLEGAK